MAHIDEVGSCSNDELEQEMCSMQARLAAATCRFLLTVGEYDRRKGWEAWECHDMAGWLAWKCGISPVTAREQVRVSRALEHLPIVRARFGEGRLSYSQVRAISRVATTATEEALVELAGVCSAAHLERIVRGYRRASEIEADQQTKRDTGRYLRMGWDDEGNLVGRFRLPAEMGAVVMNAIEALVDHEAIRDAAADGATDPAGAVRADRLADLVTAGATAISDDGPEAQDGADPRYLLTVIVDEEVLHQPVTEAPGQSDASAIRPISARRSGTCQIEDGPGLAPETVRRIACDATVETIRQADDGSVLNVGRRTRRINRPLRRALKHRDGRCRFPGCERANTQAHHVIHWIDGGETKIGNLVSLCSRHHHRLHEGGFRIEADRTGRFVFVHRHGYVLTDAPRSVAVPPGNPDDDRYRDLEPFHSDWDGTRPYLPAITEGLLLLDARAALGDPGADAGADPGGDVGAGAASAEAAPCSPDQGRNVVAAGSTGSDAG